MAFKDQISLIRLFGNEMISAFGFFGLFNLQKIVFLLAYFG